MLDNDCKSRISSNASPASDKNRIELSYIDTKCDNQNIDSNKTNSMYEKSNSIMISFQRILKKFDCLHVEKRGIERVLPEDRTDFTIINTAMIWVRTRSIESRLQELNVFKFFCFCLLDWCKYYIGA